MRSYGITIDTRGRFETTRIVCVLLIVERKNLLFSSSDLPEPFLQLQIPFQASENGTFHLQRADKGGNPSRTQLNNPSD